MRSLSRKLARARQHGLHGARRRVQQRLPVTVNELTHLLGEVSSALSRSATPPPVPTMRQLLDAFEQLDDEFGELTLDDKSKHVSVTTETIVLEGVELGRFEIRLYLDELSSLSGPRPYEVLALEPNPPAGDWKGVKRCTLSGNAPLTCPHGLYYLYVSRTVAPRGC
ncbi:hypothetical protein ACERK3_08045 [Phycisphaerales bacterium AB-hyl4]|uniref:Uncharacterized protein n=1 Tax=Natronomicrosphaera hydrolytica TaxID=3242702 RepID=A0ABV4U3S6_9BACT